jgi:hypothetical protein
LHWQTPARGSFDPERLSGVLANFEPQRLSSAPSNHSKHSHIKGLDAVRLADAKRPRCRPGPKKFPAKRNKGRSMSDHRNLSEGLIPSAAEAAKETAEERRAAERQAFADKLAKRSPPEPIERAEIEKARKRTKARAPRIAMHIEDRGTAGIVVYPDHSNDEGHMYRLADAFGTRSRQFVYSMLNGLGKATENHPLDCDFGPGSPNQLKFNAALAIIDGARPQDEIEAMLAAHMAVTNIVLLELVARTRGSIAGHRYEGDGIKRLDVLGNLTNKFMRTYTMQVEALARKRRKGEQNIRVEHVHVYAGGQAIVGKVSHRGGRGYRKK